MSIYSGFATRSQENYYDQILYNIISTLLVRISKFYHNESVDEKSFFKILTSQERCLKKLQKRKYLQPKYAELLQHFLTSFVEEEAHQRKNEHIHMNRTLSVLDKEFHELREANERQPNYDRGDAHSLTKIQEKVKRKKRSKHKKNSIKSNLDVWEFKAEKKPPELPSLQPLEQTLMTRSKFNTKINFSEVPSKDISQKDEDSFRERQERKALMKVPKFRAKMFFKQKQVH